jgi:rod shape-determining protein MreC
VHEFLARHKDGLVLSGLLIVAVVSLSVSSENVALRPGEMLHSVSGLVQRAASGVGRFFANTVTSIRELSDLQSQYDTLVEQMRQVEGLADELELLREENRRLREALDFAENAELETIPARVIAREPGSFFSGLTINKGRSHGVERDMIVIANQDDVQGLVGRIVDVGLTTSIIMPVFHADSFVAARILRSRHEGLVGGRGGSGEPLVMNYVPKSARSEIGVGDTVITSGMQSVFPEGVRIGTVESIAGKSYETSLELRLRPAVDYSRLEYVFAVGRR